MRNIILEGVTFVGITVFSCILGLAMLHGFIQLIFKYENLSYKQFIKDLTKR